MKHTGYMTKKTPENDKWKKALVHAVLDSGNMTLCDVWHRDDLDPTFAGDTSPFCVECAKGLAKRGLL
jgi:hypothetical protein